jgi:hypothetical protein
MALIAKPRVRLRQYLEKRLIEDQSTGFAPLLRQALEGLQALRFGEVQAIFAPDDKQGAKDGTKPYTLRRLRMMGGWVCRPPHCQELSGEGPSYSHCRDCLRGESSHLQKMEN